jgi:hypothetical protein
MAVKVWVVTMVLLYRFCAGFGTGGDQATDVLCLGSLDYNDALAKAIQFFEGQRSGRLPANQRTRWRGNSALADGRQENVSSLIITKHCINI